MGILIRDNLVNLITGLGTSKDPTTMSIHNLILMDRGQLEIAYRSNWLAKRIVNSIAEDATREWRNWQAPNDSIEKIEQTETDFDVQRKVKQTIIRARLYGGAALVMGVDQGQPQEELDIESVGKGDLKFVIAVTCWDLAPGPMNWDALSPYYGRPQYYTVTSRIQTEGPDAGKLVQIHPSRIIPFVGHAVPDPTMNISSLGDWGDSVLTDVDEVIKDFGLTIGGVANMVNDAKLDVIKIPDFSKNIATQEYAERLLRRFSYANAAKSTVNSLLLDNEEEWERIQTTFSGLPDIMQRMITVVSGAAGIPVSRLMGQAPSKGLGSTSGGEQDMMNYYDTVAALQKTVFGPALAPLDKIIQAHTLGKIDDTIFYEWAPLYTPDPGVVATIALQKAQAAQLDVTMALINPDALREARINQLIEDGTYPGLEAAIDEHGSEPPPPPADPNYDPSAPKPKPGDPKPEPDKGGGSGGGNKLEIVHSVAPVKDRAAAWSADFNPFHEPGGSPKGGQFAPAKGGVTAVSFVSPNTKEGLDVEAAVAGTKSLAEQKLIEVSDKIDKGLKLTSESMPVVGAWSDGAEHSVMTTYHGGDFKTVLAAAAMKAHIADQKAVLVFHEKPEGGSYLLEFKAKGSLERINEDLLKDGVVFHTLQPITSKIGRVVGANVIVWAGDKDTFDAVAKGATRYGSKVQYTEGEGQFLGSSKESGTDREVRDDARAVYEGTIAGNGSNQVKKVWSDVGASSGSGLVTFGGLTPNEQKLSVLSILDPSYPSKPQRSENVSDIAKVLDKRGQRALKDNGFPSGKIEGPSPKGDMLIARVLASEVEGALQRRGSNSTQWYTSDFAKAMELAALTHPELAKDPNAATAYKLALAITSQGEVVTSNVRLTEQAYGYFKQHGRFPTDIEAKNQEPINGNFAKINALLDKLGPDKTREFLSKEFKAGDLQKMGYRTDENVDEKVYGSAILGAKIGNGFYQNLSGNYNPMTFDLWWMRGWGRLTGTLTSTVTAEAKLKQELRLVHALHDENYKIPRTDKAMMGLVEKILAKHEVDFRTNRASYDNGDKSKSELVLAAERYYIGREGIKQQPASGGERTWMRDVGAKAIELLSSKGITITPADLQATWWYPEKTLYDKLGGRDSEAINTNYASAIADVARRNGKSESDIRRIVG